MTIPSNLLDGKKVLIGVTGSIAAYKTLDLVRLFIKAGAEVKVVMSDAAKKFVTPLSFEALSRHQVLEEQSESWSSDHNHIQAVAWADLFVIAPCSANTLAKLANAIADNLLLQCALADPKTKLIAPSANTHMLENPLSKANLKMLAIANYEVVPTQVKELACQTTGDGAMAEPLDIFYHAARLLLKESYWQDRRVIVTGGGTIEKIDDVRYISNFSSGKMASALATALYCKGADVNLIATRFENNLPHAVHKIHVDDSEEMLEYLNDSIRIAKKGLLSKASLMNEEQIHLIQKEPYLFMAAAVSDYVVSFPQQGKMKKAHLGECFSLELKQNRDLLSSIDKEGIITVAFKAEMDAEHAYDNAKALLERKNVDAVCLNVLRDANSFGSSENALTLMTREGDTVLDKQDKFTLSLKLLEVLRGQQG